MAARNRKDVIDLTEVGIYSCASRCVRRGRFTGHDLGGLDVSHRRRWVVERLQDLVTVFAVEVLDYGVVDNAIHTLLRNRPDLTSLWSDEEVVRRWMQLNRQRLKLNTEPLPQKKLRRLVKLRRRVREWRQRLSDPSWFMIMLKEPLARAANHEDRVSGHFFGERFSCERCETFEDILQASLFTNMTPVQAGLVKRPQEAEFTSFRDRMDDAQRPEESREVALPDRRKSDWLAPLLMTGDGHDEAAVGRRPSNDGFLPFGLETYAAMIDSCQCGPREPTDNCEPTDDGSRSIIKVDWYRAATCDDLELSESMRNGVGLRVLLPVELPECLKCLGFDQTRWRDAYCRNSRRFDRITRQTDELRWDFEQAAALGTLSSWDPRDS